MRILAFLTALLLVASGGAAAALSVGVAPFAQVAPSGDVVPDVATRLAEWLAANGVQKVVGPAELGGPAVGNPSAAQVGTWARKAGVEAVVAGRTTRIGRALSVDARVLEGSTGAALGTPIVIEVERPQDLGKAIQSLTTQVAARLQGGKAGSPPPAAAAEPASKAVAPSPATPPQEPHPVASAPAPEAPPAAQARSGPMDSKKPISIQADQLEATEQSQAKHLVFTGNVNASQGDLTLRSDRLEAFYPPGGSSPDRLEATGHVVVSEPGRKARCDKAVYLRKESRVICTGQTAELTQDCDRVAGKTIIFHLDTDVLQVDGRADVHLQSEATTTCTPPANANTAEAKP